jgi:hypothetical protein
LSAKCLPEALTIFSRSFFFYNVKVGGIKMTIKIGYDEDYLSQDELNKLNLDDDIFVVRGVI